MINYLETIKVKFTDQYGKAHEAEFDIVDLCYIQSRINHNISVYGIIAPRLVVKRFDIIQLAVQQLENEGWITGATNVHI